MKKIVVAINELNVDVGDNPTKYLKDNKDFVLDKYGVDILRVDFDDGTFYVISKETKREPKKFKLHVVDGVSAEDIARFDSFTKASNHKAPESVIKSRMRICKECDQFVKSENRCKKCGCGIKGKVVLADSFCPSKRWTKHER